METTNSRRSFKLFRILPLIAILSLMAFVFIFIPPVYLLKHFSVTVERFNAKQEMLSIKVGPGEKDWVPFEKIPRLFFASIIVAEDAHFREHPGIDMEAIQKAWEYNAKSKKIRGASTITQQVVRNAFLSHERTWIRKIREAVGALLIEKFLTKDEILTWYVNLCEFGPGIYGVKQAAQHYFRTRPEYLTLAQNVHLTVVIPSPRKWSKGLSQKDLTSFGHKRFRKILKELRGNGFISPETNYKTLASGNFGRPIIGFVPVVESTATERKTDDEIDEIDESEDELPEDIEPSQEELDTADTQIESK